MHIKFLFYIKSKGNLKKKHFTVYSLISFQILIKVIKHFKNYFERIKINFKKITIN